MDKAGQNQQINSCNIASTFDLSTEKFSKNSNPLWDLCYTTMMFPSGKHILQSYKTKFLFAFPETISKFL